MNSTPSEDLRKEPYFDPFFSLLVWRASTQFSSYNFTFRQIVDNWSLFDDLLDSGVREIPKDILAVIEANTVAKAGGGLPS